MRSPGWWQGRAALIVFAVLGVLVVAGVATAVAYSIPSGSDRGQRTTPYDGAAEDDDVPLLDVDQDRVPDVEENLLFSTQRLQSDSDGDGAPDAWETAYSLDPNDPEDGDQDPDRDGLTNQEEYTVSRNLLASQGFGEIFDPSLGLSPFDHDTDSDDLPDGWEVQFGLDPLLPNGEGSDGDGDTLTDRQEFEAGSDPLNFDTDGDSLDDGSEVRIYLTDPAKADTDGDGMPDWWEVQFGLDPTDANDRFGDDDNDGLLNLLEFRSDTDPHLRDTDGDTIPDGWEVAFGLDPTSFADGTADPDADGLDNAGEYGMVDTIYHKSTDPLDPDADEDGLADGLEAQHETNPDEPDTDGDGLTDGDEIHRYGTNPLTKDTDGDGLIDGDEIITTGTSPISFDTDADAIDDGREWVRWNYRMQRGEADLVELGILPAIIQQRYPGADHDVLIKQMGPLGDADRDGRINILDEDSDDDGLRDGEEFREPSGKVYGCTIDDVSHFPEGLPLDTILEAMFGSQGSSFNGQPPVGPDPADPDTDGDLMPDGWEVTYGLGPCDDSDADDDPDGDGVWVYGITDDEGNVVAEVQSSPANRPVPPEFTVPIAYFQYTNLHEYQNGTHPLATDTDCDLMPDGWEVWYSEPDPDTDLPRPNPNGFDADDDLDEDGYDHQGAVRNGEPVGDGVIEGTENFTALEEWFFFTSPRNENSDGGSFEDRDGNTHFLGDGAEVYFAARSEDPETATPGLANNGALLLGATQKTKQGNDQTAGCFMDYSDMPYDPADLQQWLQPGAPVDSPDEPGQSGGASGLAIAVLALLALVVPWLGRPASRRSRAA